MDAVVTARGGIVYVFSGTQYFRFSGGTFGAARTPATRSRSSRTRTACPGGGGSTRRSPRPAARPTTSTRTAAACRRRPPRTSSGRCATTGAGSHPTTRRRTTKARRTTGRRGRAFFDDRDAGLGLRLAGPHLPDLRRRVHPVQRRRRTSTRTPTRSGSRPTPRACRGRRTPSCSPTPRTTYSFDNTAKTCTRTQGGSSGDLPDRGPGERAVRRAARHRRGLRPRRAAVPGQRRRSSSATRSPAGRSPTSSTPATPRACSVDVDALVEIGGQIHVFSGDRYGRLAAGAELDTAVELKPIQGNWGNLPYHFRTGLDAAGATAAALYLFRGDRYVRYPTDRAVRRPAHAAVRDHERPVRDHPADHRHRRHAQPAAARRGCRRGARDRPPRRRTRPRRSTRAGRRRTVIKVQRDRVDDAHLPVSSHLDFDSANGIYYWEAFFHAPLLIAQALQRRRSGSPRRSSGTSTSSTRPGPGTAGGSCRSAPSTSARSSTPARRRFGVLGGTSAAGARQEAGHDSSTRSARSRPVFAQEREVRGDEEAVLRRDLPQPRRGPDGLRDPHAAAEPAGAPRSPRRCEAALASLQEAAGDHRAAASAATTSWWAGSRPRCAGTWTTRSTRTRSRRCAPAPTAAPW